MNMPPLPDLVRDSKLETIFHETTTEHKYIEAGGSRRRVHRYEHWKREKQLGHGAYGQVWLERCTESANQGSVRAVKVVRKRERSSHAVDYNRKLEAVAKFSHPKV